MTLHDRSFGDTSNAATVAVMKRDVSLLMEKISSGTPRVVTATVAVSDVSPHGLWRNVKYRSSQRAREMEMVMVREMEILREMIKSSATSQCAFEFLVVNVT